MCVYVCKEKSKEEEKRGELGGRKRMNGDKGLLSLVFYECLCPGALGKPRRGMLGAIVITLKIPQRDLNVFVYNYFFFFCKITRNYAKILLDRCSFVCSSL